MRIIEFLKDIFGGKDTVYVKERIESQKYKLDIERFAVEMAINMIAGLIAKCEFKTYMKGNEVKSDEYYLWNIEPNVNQNSSEFIQKLVFKLLEQNEVLIVQVNNQLLIADSFSKFEYALFPCTFSCVTCGNFTFDKTFSMQDVLYYKLNNNNIRTLLSNLMTGYSNLLDMAIGKYKRAGGRKGIARLDKIKTGDKEKNAEIDDLFNYQFKKYFENENAVVSLPRAVDYEEITGEGGKKSTSEVNDITNITKEIVARTAQSFKMPPALLMGEIADTDKAINQLLTFCIDPLTDLIETEINRKRYGKPSYLAQTYLKIDTTCIKHIDIFDVAVQIDKLISDGIYSIDELRTKAGDGSLNTDFSKKHWITKNYSDIENLEGGDTVVKN